MESYIFKIETLSETEDLGLVLGQNAQAGFIYCLDGDLGAGKTTLTQAIARGMKLSNGEYISSPSFAIMHEYDGEIPLYHMDFYRLYSSDDVLALGFDEYFSKSGLTVIEWSKRAEDLLPEDILTLDVQFSPENIRIITISASDVYSSLLRKIKNKFPCN